jgi:hypothetical protein
MPPEVTPAPSAADFDQAFSASASPGIRRVWELAEPGLPAEVEPFSFVSAGLLRHVLQATGLGPGQTLADPAAAAAEARKILRPGRRLAAADGPARPRCRRRDRSVTVNASTGPVQPWPLLRSLVRESHPFGLKRGRPPVT